MEGEFGMEARQLAAQLYTVRRFMETPEDIERTLRNVRDIGYSAVQVSGMGPIDPARLKSIVDELDIRICATHIPLEHMEERLAEVIQTHRLWNCEYVGLGSMPNEYRSSKEGYETFAKKFADIGRRLENAGLHLVYHNHNFEFQKFDGLTGFDILLNEAGPGTYSMEIDTYWVQAGGGNPSEWIRRAKGAIHVVHLKDMAVLDREAVYAEIGEGNFNWDDILEACHEADVKWYIVEQDECQRDPFESLDISLKYLLKRTRGGE